MQAGIKGDLNRLFRPPSADPVAHYFLIDLLRGLAALAILFWHYQHFIAGGVSTESRRDYPLYDVFWPLYEQGGAAVQLFWIISGFVFAAVYLGRPTSAAEFASNRFARLYPLHLLTLIVVAVLQAISLHSQGRWLIYDNNDAYHFVLNLFFASAWGLERGFSFNGPIWSVSAEIFIYALFWMTIPFLFRKGILFPLLLSAIGVIISKGPFLDSVGQCGFYFFIGCSVYAVHRAFQFRWTRRLLAGLATVAAFGLYWAGLQGIGTLFLFIGIVLGVATLETTAAGQWGKSARWIGDNTYGVYLWHIPVQLAVLLILPMIGIGADAAYSPWFLALFLAGMMALARISFVYFEDPWRRRLRKSYKREGAPIAAP